MQYFTSKVILMIQNKCFNNLILTHTNVAIILYFSQLRRILIQQPLPQTILIRSNSSCSFLLVIFGFLTNRKSDLSHLSKGNSFCPRMSLKQCPSSLPESVGKVKMVLQEHCRSTHTQRKNCSLH